MAQPQQHPSPSLDALYCEEEKWEDDVEEFPFQEETVAAACAAGGGAGLSPLLMLEQVLLWEDEELQSLFSKERQQQRAPETDPFLYPARRAAVEWMLRVNAHYGFSTLTAVLAINYLDKFLSSVHFQRDKPWMVQLVAVTCLSLAAKVEETQVPLLLDLQVEDAKYEFEAKTIQRMELLLLSTLKWKMHPVTPLSFLDHITRRLGMKTHLHWEFFRRCERLLLSVVSDARFVGYLPSVLATATMMHVIEQVEPHNHVGYQNQLLEVLKITKDKVNDCYELIVGLSNTHVYDCYNPLKRKNDQTPASPSGVIDVCFSWDHTDESWSAGPPMKRSRVQGQQQQQMRLPSLTRVFVDVVGSPR